MRDFKLVDKFSGYINKRDVTNVGTTFLTAPSQNVLINEGEKVAARPGYTLFGAANSAETPIQFADTWINSNATELPFRAFSTKLQYYYDGEYRDLLTGLSSAAFNWTTWWDDTEKVDLAIFVNGTPNLYAWNGAIAEVASVTANTITKTGTATWAESRFFTAGNKTIVIGGVEYTYTGGESTTTLTGVTGNPSSGGVVAGDIAIQKVITTANQPGSGVNNDIISCIKNQIYVADTEQRLVYISTVLDYTDFTTQATPREPGDSEILTLDGTPNAFIPQEDTMYISAGTDQWYAVMFKTSDDLLNETLAVDRLKTGPFQAAVGQASVEKVKNDIMFVTKEPSIDTLGRITNVEKPQSVPLSDEIQDLIDTLDTTIPPVVKYFKRNVYISYPSSSIVLVYDVSKGFWQPPWVMGIRAFSIYNGDLYGHSSRVAESYKMLDGYNDNGGAYECIAAFSYRNYGKRGVQKEFDEYYVEGYIASNTTLNLDQEFEYEGFESIVSKTISGTQTAYLFSGPSDISLGTNPLGDEPLGDSVETAADLSKFRKIFTGRSVDFYEYRPVYSSNQADARWEILAEGPNTRYSKADSIHIKE